MNKDDRESLERLEGKVDDIKDNHLTHIYERLGFLSGSLGFIKTTNIAIIAGIFVLIVAIVLQTVFGISVGG